MKPILHILFSLLLFSCSEKPEAVEFVPAKFQIDTITVELNYTPRDIIQYRDGFLCRISPDGNESLPIIFLDKNFNLDIEYSKELSLGLSKTTEAIWANGDTLFAICNYGYKKYDVRRRPHNKWTIINTGSVIKESYRSNQKNLPIYKDDEFQVRSCCKGEFGGALYFDDLKSGKTYSCPSTCLASIQKFDGSFYVTSSLAGYFASVIKIDNPRGLFEIHHEGQLNDCSWYDIYPEDPTDEIKHPKGYDKGYQTIIDTFEIAILGSFELKNHLYWIYSDTENAYVGYAEDKKLKTIDTIYNKQMYRHEIRDLMHNSNIIPIRSREMKGLIILEGNKIRIVEFKSNTTNTQ